MKRSWILALAGRAPPVTASLRSELALSTHWSHSTCDSKVATQVDARCAASGAASRGNDIERREVGLETAGVPGQQLPTLDGGVGSDEEVGQHLPLAAAAPAV